MTITGNDLLPYTYIDRIDLYDNHVEVSAFSVDSEDGWATDPLSQKYFRMMIITTTSRNLSNLIRSGNMNLQKTQIMKEDPDAVISIFKVSNMNIASTSDGLYYKKTIKHKYKSGSSYLYAYAAMIVDPVEVAGSKYINEGYIQGPIAAENVINPNTNNKITNVFTLPDGNQWSGPVHRHP